MSDGAVPELAITAFERTHDLVVTVYDLGGRLQQFLDPQRLQHRHPVCQAVKANGGQARCERFEVERVYAELAERPEGRVHVCHAGVVEWAMPLFRDGRMELLLCAGARRPGARGLPPPRRPLADPAGLSTVEDEAIERIRECLRQLATRLGAWLDELGRSPVRSRRQDGPGDVHLVDRRARIVRFIHLHHTGEVTLASLARDLGLSPARASAAVRRCCGATFQELLRGQRLETAADLLRHTSLPMVEVAAASGFADRAHFSRCFRRRFGHPPGRMRRRWRPAASTR